MFEAFETMIDSFNILGVGLYIAVAGLVFAIARGMSRGNREQTLLWTIALGIFGVILTFNDDYIKGLLFITVSILIIIYGLTKLGIRKPDHVPTDKVY